MSEQLKLTARDSYYDNLRLFLMFTVVFCHGIENIRAASGYIAVFHELLLCFVMPLFVFVTGFFAKGMAKENNPKRIRILDIILLYTVTQILKNLMVGYPSFLKPTFGNWYLVGMVAWFMILPLISKLKPGIVIGCSVIAGLLIGMDPNANLILQSSRVICFFPFFLLGFYITKEQTEVLKKKKFYLIGIIVIIAVSLFYICIWRNVEPFNMLHANRSYAEMELTNLQGCMIRLGWYATTVIMGFGIMCIIPRRHTHITILGARTMPIFIIHTFIYLYLIEKTDFFTYIGNCGSTYVAVGFIFLLSMIMMLVCGNKYFAKIFDWIMAYDFRHFMKKQHKS